MKMFAKRALIVLAFGFAGFTGRHGGADDSPGIVMLRGSYRSTAAVSRNERTGEYRRTSREDVGERPNVTLSRVEWPYPKEQPAFGPPMVSPPAVPLRQSTSFRDWPVYLAVPVRIPGRIPCPQGLQFDMRLRGAILPGPEGGMIIGGPLGGTILPGREGGMIIGGPLGGTILPGEKCGMLIGGR